MRLRRLVRGLQPYYGLSAVWNDHEGACLIIAPVLQKRGTTWQGRCNLHPLHDLRSMFKRHFKNGGAGIEAAGRRLDFRPRVLERITTLDGAQRREILKQIDEITKQMWKRHHEETRQKTDELYEELYRRIKELDDDAGEAPSR